MAKKILLMLCMLVVTTAQLYSNAFAMPMANGSAFPVYEKTSHETHVTSQQNIDEVGENCCEQLMAENRSHCSTMPSNSFESCDEMTDCAQMQCVSPVDSSLSNYLFDFKSSIVNTVAANDAPRIDNNRSPYRPPITH